MHIVLFAN